MWFTCLWRGGSSRKITRYSAGEEVSFALPVADVQPALFCLSLLLDLLSSQANLLQAFYFGNLLFITLRISIHIFTRLRPCEKLDPHHPTSVLPLWKVFHCWAVRNHYKPEEQIPSYECLQLASRTWDDVWAVIGSLLPLVLRNTTPLWKEDSYCLNTSALKDHRVIKPWASHCCEELQGLSSPKLSNRGITMRAVLPVREEQTLVRYCSSKCWPWPCPGLVDGTWFAEWPSGLGDCAQLPAAALCLLSL